ncbi:MAG: hypothetical protein ACSHXI_05580 [Hoeflea sp.]|uniref:hypothetical protein n=1 Tax=Hoeflea sp. TaxID=1940281 RepID=UPI003EF8DBD7
MAGPLFFLHIPKTAGTSLRLSLERACRDRVVHCYPPFEGGDPMSKTGQLQDNAIVCGHLSWGTHIFYGAQPNYAAILREPLERLTSWYGYKRASPERDHTGEIAENSLADLVATGNPELNNHMTQIISGINLTPSNGPSAFALACENLKNFAWVSTNHRLHKDIQALSDYVGVRIPRARRVNVGKPVTISDADKRAVIAANQLDSALFAYAESIAAMRSESARSRSWFRKYI